jgi:hypothetical protein
LRELELSVDDVLGSHVRRCSFSGLVVLARVDPDVGYGVLQAAHARAVEARLEDEPEHVAAHRALYLEGRLSLSRDREISLAPEVERLQRDRNCFAMFVAEP